MYLFLAVLYVPLLGGPCSSCGGEGSVLTVPWLLTVVGSLAEQGSRVLWLAAHRLSGCGLWAFFTCSAACVIFTD